jgi:DNA-binding transcriptional LysR family regulator
MELRQLRYFAAVAEELNVRQAPTRLHLSQPPLSRQIHDLEDEVGTKLFVRSQSGMRLTEAGRTFLKEARNPVASDAKERSGVAAASDFAGQGHDDCDSRRPGFGPQRLKNTAPGQRVLGSEPRKLTVTSAHL